MAVVIMKILLNAHVVEAWEYIKGEASVYLIDGDAENVMQYFSRQNGKVGITLTVLNHLSGQYLRIDSNDNTKNPRRNVSPKKLDRLLK